MSAPQAAIVGRPNVGKSSIFNWLVGKRLAIVDDIAGVTRDRLGHVIERDDRRLELVDTGGIGIKDMDNLTREVESQIQTALESADLLLFVVDIREGVTPLDRQVAERLRKGDATVLLVANKADADTHEKHAAELFQLGFGKPVLVSAHQRRGRDDLMDKVEELCPAVTAAAMEEDDEPVMKLAIVGRRNAGKSTFINSLLQTERMITSDVPGTTRDSVDVRFELDGKAFIAIDTPGLARSKSVKSDLEYYSLHRAKRSIRYADVALIFFDVAEGIGKVEKQLVNYVADESRPCIFVANKWDLVKGDVSTSQWVEHFRNTFRNMQHVPIAFITGKTGKNAKRLLNHAQMLFKQAHKRISTGELNRLVHAAVDSNPPPLFRNRRPKIYYAAQAEHQPPTFVFFCNEPQGFSASYQRYLLNFIRERLEFSEVPIRLRLRGKGDTEASERVFAASSGK